MDINRQKRTETDRNGQKRRERDKNTMFYELNMFVTKQKQLSRHKTA